MRVNLAMICNLHIEGHIVVVIMFTSHWYLQDVGYIMDGDHMCHIMINTMEG